MVLHCVPLREQRPASAAIRANVPLSGWEITLLCVIDGFASATLVNKQPASQIPVTYASWCWVYYASSLRVSQFRQHLQQIRN